MQVAARSITAVLVVAGAAGVVSIAAHEERNEAQSANTGDIDTSWQSPAADFVFTPRVDGYYTADTETYLAGRGSGELAHRIYLRFFADGTFCTAADELGSERARSSIMTSLAQDPEESFPAGETHCDNRWQASALVYEIDIEPSRRVEVLAADDDGFLVMERNDTARSTIKTGYRFHAAPTG